MSVPTPLNTQGLAQSPIAHGKNSPNPVCVKVPIDFSAGGTLTYVLDVGQLIQLQKIDQVVSVYIDNLSNAAQCTVFFQSSGQSITVEPNSQGFYPALQANLGQMFFTMTGGTATTNVYLLNVETPYLVWGSNVSVSGLNFDGAGNALVSDAKLDAIISGGKLSVTDAILDACVSANKVQVQDAAIEAIISGGNLAVSDAALEALISGGALTVKDTTLDGIVSNGAASVRQIGRSFSNITTATTANVKSGAGTLSKIVVNTQVASATITIYDNTAASGTKIGTITLPSTITGADPLSLVYDLAFATGLTIVTSGATDLTVIYS